MSTCAHERLRQVWCTHHVAKTEADEVVAPPLARRLHLPALDRLRSEGVTQRPARGSRPVVGRQRHWGCCSIAREALNGENADPVKSGVLDIGLCEPALRPLPQCSSTTASAVTNRLQLTQQACRRTTGIALDGRSRCCCGLLERRGGQREARQHTRGWRRPRRWRCRWAASGCHMRLLTAKGPLFDNARRACRRPIFFILPESKRSFRSNRFLDESNLDMCESSINYKDSTVCRIRVKSRHRDHGPSLHPNGGGDLLHAILGVDDHFRVDDLIGVDTMRDDHIGVTDMGDDHIVARPRRAVSGANCASTFGKFRAATSLPRV